MWGGTSLRCRGKATLIMPFYFFEWLGIWGVCFILFFCCKANLSIIGNAKQVEFTVLLINYFLIQLWIIDFQTCMRHHFASKLSCEEECIWKGIFSPAPKERWWLSPFCVLLHIKLLSSYTKMQVLCVIYLETYRTSWDQYE